MSAKNQRREPWRNAERHYCAICNVWMASDRQSILLHENGRKHIENQEKAMQKKRKEKKQEEAKQHALMASIQQMEKEAFLKNAQDYGFGSSHSMPFIDSSQSSFVTPHAISNQTTQSLPVPQPHITKSADTDEKEQWRKKKQQRDKSNSEADEGDKPITSKRRKILPDEGHYAYGGKTFLEGPVFGELLEEDMPVQIWTGPKLASLFEKRLPDRDMYWKNAIVAAVRQHGVHISYLETPGDTDETIQKNVPLDRIRIILGADESIPDSLDEARIMAVGGEELNVETSEKAIAEETTGLTAWSTVTIKRTTVRQEVKEERARLREVRKQASDEKEAKEKESESRKLEELKVANADDSALGAVYFAELGREVQGYKGVDISATGDDTLTVEDTVGRKLSAGTGSFGFKKMKKKATKNPSRRTTSADNE